MPDRVLIVGPCGSGKSTLARRLAPLLGLPLYHMDKLNWRPGWIESSKDEISERLSAIVAQDRWLIDGTYGGTLSERLPRADTIVYLDYPVRLCLRRLVKRIAFHRGEARPDMTEGCPERFDLGFFFYVATWNLGPGPRLDAKLAPHEDKVIRLKSPKGLEAWLARVAAQST